MTPFTHSSDPPQQDEISPDEAAERITRELRAHPAARWDRFIQYSGKARIYGWLDRTDGRADFLLLDFDSHTGELLEWITSAHPHPASVVERLESDDSVVCQRVEHCFDVPNAVRLTQPEADPEVPRDECLKQNNTLIDGLERIQAETGDAVRVSSLAQTVHHIATSTLSQGRHFASTQPVSESPGDSGVERFLAWLRKLNDQLKATDLTEYGEGEAAGIASALDEANRLLGNLTQPVPGNSGGVEGAARDLIEHLIYSECGVCGLPNPERPACSCDACRAIGARTAALRDALTKGVGA